MALLCKFQGAINSKVNQAGLLLKRNNVNNPKAPGDVLAPTVGKHPSFCLGLNGKASCLRIKIEPKQGQNRRGAAF